MMETPVERYLKSRRVGILFGLFYVYICCTYLLDLLPSIGITVPVPGIISTRTLLLVLTVIGIPVLIRNRYVRAPRLSTFFLLLCMYCVLVTIIHADIQQQPPYYYLATIIFPWSITYLTEHLMTKDHVTQCTHHVAHYVSWFVLLFFGLVCYYRLDPLRTLTGSGEAAIYYVLTLLPFILCLKGPKHIFLLLLVIAATFIAFKRTAVVALAVGLFLYFFVRLHNRDEKKMRLFIRVCLAIAAIIVIYQIVVAQTGNDVIGKLLHTQEDGGSGRSDVYASVLAKYAESGIIDKIFGIGYNGVRYSYHIIISGNVLSAHNDFLEVLVDYGIIGLIMYLGFVIKMIKTYMTLKRHESSYAAPLAASLGIFIVISTFSHLLLYPTYFINILIFFVLMERETETLCEEGDAHANQCSCSNL